MNFEDSVKRVEMLSRLGSAASVSKSPEYIYEVYQTLAEMISVEMGQGEDHPIVQEIRRNLKIVEPMFGKAGPQDAWTLFRQSLPRRDRRAVAKEPSEEYVLLWSHQQRAQAQKDIQDLLNGIGEI